jgi:hypothetical protein
MEDAIKAMTEAGYGDALIAAAGVTANVTIEKIAEGAGTYHYEVECFDDDEGDYYDETRAVTHEANAILCRNEHDDVVAYKVADFVGAVRDVDVEADFAAGERVMLVGTERVCSIDEHGNVVGYDPETGTVRQVEATSFVFFDREGAVALNARYMEPRAQFEALMEKADTLPFDPQGYFQRLYDVRIELGEPAERSRLYFLYNSLQLAAGETLEIPDFGEARLTDECWEQTLASVPEDLREKAQDTMLMAGMIQGQEETTMGKRIRAIFAALAPMPVHDFRGSMQTIGAELAAQRDPVSQSRSEYLDELVENGGREVEISPELTNAVAGLYGECQMRIVESGEMRVLLVLDHMSANMYFYPTVPQLEDRPAPAFGY